MPLGEAWVSTEGLGVMVTRILGLSEDSGTEGEEKYKPGKEQPGPVAQTLGSAGPLNRVQVPLI